MTSLIFKIWQGVGIVSVLFVSAALTFTQTTDHIVQLCFVGSKDLADPLAPSFEKYPAHVSASGLSGKLDLNSNPIARRYRTVIRSEISKGPNFAGHYRLAVWGCGSSCAQYAVVNLKTGHVITAQSIETVRGVHVAADDFLPHTDSREWGFRFRRDSNLLVFVGTINEDDSKEGAFYYVLTGDSLALLHRTIAARNTCQGSHE